MRHLAAQAGQEHEDGREHDPEKSIRSVLFAVRPTIRPSGKGEISFHGHGECGQGPRQPGQGKGDEVVPDRFAVVEGPGGRWMTCLPSTVSMRKSGPSARTTPTIHAPIRTSMVTSPMPICRVKSFFNWPRQASQTIAVSRREDEPQRPLDERGHAPQHKGEERPAPLALAGERPVQAAVAEQDERREQEVHARVVEQPGQEERGEQDKDRSQAHGPVEMQRPGQPVGGEKEKQAGEGRAQKEDLGHVRRGQGVQEPEEPEIDRRLVRVGLAVEGQDHPFPVQDEVLVGVGVAHLIREPERPVAEGEPGLGEHGEYHGQPRVVFQSGPDAREDGGHLLPRGEER